MKEEYCALIKEVRQLLEKTSAHSTKQKLPALHAGNLVTKEKKEIFSTEEKQEEIVVIDPPAPSLPKKIAETPIRCGTFILEKNKQIPPLDLSPIRDTLQKILPPQALLLCLEPTHLPFLQKVAHALTTHGMVVHSSYLNLQDNISLEEVFLKSPTPTFITEFDPRIAAICSLSQETTYHKYFLFSHKKRILFLHPIHIYQSDIEKKRNLWNNLKTLLLQ